MNTHKNRSFIRNMYSNTGCIDEYSPIINVLEDGYKSLCDIWSEIGVHSQEKRSQMKEAYINYCMDLLKPHLQSWIDEEEAVMD